MHPVPDFFQDTDEPALLAQVAWMDEELQLPTEFFVRLLRIDSGDWERWRKGEAPLAEPARHSLRSFWRLVLRLLSFQNFDLDRVRTLLHVAPAGQESIRRRLEGPSRDAIEEITRWVTSFRFGDRYAPAPPTEAGLCPPRLQCL
jgi:hypothetical protein